MNPRADLRRQLTVHRALMPPSGDLAEFVARVAQARERPIVQLPVALSNDQPSGLWVATADRDYIAYPATASVTRKAAIICHELAHMLLGHAPQPDIDGLTSMTSTLVTHLDPKIAARILHRHHYAEDPEVAAEGLGTLFTLELRKRETASQASHDRVYDRLR